MPSDLRLGGATNFRALGGFDLASGGQMAQGRIYRSNHLGRLSVADFEIVSELGIRAVVDLRSEKERQAQPSLGDWSSARIMVSPKANTDFIFDPMFARGETRVEAWIEAFAGFYATMPEIFAEEFEALLRLIIEGHTPLLVHCSAGKDRTGVACALILEALGVPRDRIVADYLESGVRLESDAHFANMLSEAKLTRYAGLPKECRQVMYGVDAAYLVGALEALDAGYGSVSGYLTDRLSFTPLEVATLRSALTVRP